MGSMPIWEVSPFNLFGIWSEISFAVVNAVQGSRGLVRLGKKLEKTASTSTAAETCVPTEAKAQWINHSEALS